MYITPITVKDSFSQFPVQKRKTGNYRTWLPTLKANLENEEFMAEQENYEQELWNKLSSSEKSQRGGDNRCKKK